MQSSVCILNTSAPASNLYSLYLSIECIAALDACSFIAARTRNCPGGLPLYSIGVNRDGGPHLSLPAIGAIEKYELSS